MSTNIKIDVVLRRLQEQAKQALGQNRAEREEREEVLLREQQRSDQRSTQVIVFNTNTEITERRLGFPEELRKSSAEEHSDVPDLYKRRRPGAQRTPGELIAFAASGFNSSFVPTLKVYPPPSLYPAYPNEITETAWVQVQAGVLRFVVGETILEVPVDTYSTGFSYRLSSNKQILIRAWNITRDGGFPPVGEMEQFDTFGGRYRAPREPMVSSSGRVVWLVWQYRLDFASSYGTGVDRFGVVFSRGAYQYTNRILFVRYDTRTGETEQKLVSYDQFATTAEFRAIYLQSCFEDDPSKELRANGYRYEYNVKNGTAYFLRALDEDRLAYNYPYSQLADGETGAISASDWTIHSFTLSTEEKTISQQIAELNTFYTNLDSPDEAVGVRFPTQKYQALGDSLFEGFGVSPVPDNSGGARNSQVPLYVLQ